MPKATLPSGSGSYYYPVNQVPNSSYPTVDMREVATPTSSSMVGRMFVDTDGILKYMDPDGVVSGLSILSGSLVVTGSLQIDGDLAVFGDATYISSSNLLVDDPLIVMARSQSASPTYDAGLIMERGTSENVGFLWDESDDIFALVRTDEDGTTAGDVTINGYRHLKVDNLSLNSGSVYSENEHLVFSSSAGSVVALSATLKFPDGTTQDTAHVVTGSGDFFVTNELVVSGSVVSPGHLIFSSSAGSVVVVSGALRVDDQAIIVGDAVVSGTLFASDMVAVGSDMILSSSFSSSIAISGNLKLDQGTADVSISTGGGDIVFASSPVVGSWELPEDAGPVVLVDMPISATPSAGDEMSYEFALDSNPVAKVYGEADGSGGVQNLSFQMLTDVPLISSGSHLILSSSVGSVIAASGSFKLGQFTQAALPVGSNTLSGSMVWVTDVKVAAVYGPEGWTRVLTGSL